VTPVDLEAVFLGLHSPATADMAAAGIGPGGIYRLARQRNGAPALLVALGSSAPPATEPPEPLLHMRYIPRRRLAIDYEGGGGEIGVFAVLGCHEVDDYLQFAFFRVVALLLDELGHSPSPLAVDSAVHHLFELFRDAQQTRSKSLVGLWAELALIAVSPHPRAAAAAWRVSRTARHDFASGSERVEVKAAVGPVRRHFFSLDQLLGDTSISIVIASALLSPLPAAEGGRSVTSLLDLIGTRLAPNRELYRRVLSIASSTSVQVDDAGVSHTYDLPAFVAHLQFFAAEQVPQVNPCLPSGVSDVRFAADLGLSSPLEGIAEGERTPLLRALQPRRE
jgi:hypothetical protein